MGQARLCYRLARRAQQACGSRRLFHPGRRGLHPQRSGKNGDFQREATINQELGGWRQSPRKEPTMEQLIERYRKLYTEAGTGGEETNDQIAYKNILTTLRNSTNLESARRRIQAIRGWCTNQDRKEIYQ